MFSQISILFPLAFGLLASAAPIRMDLQSRGLTPAQHKANGLAAQKLNDSFKSLKAGGSCTSGQNACIDGGFAQCVNGKFQVSPCGGGLKCEALPLVNSVGTSVTCDTEADAKTRISSSKAGQERSLNGRALSSAQHKTNGAASLAANKKFAGLTPNSKCTNGEDACINGQFSVCSNGKFILTQCPGGTVCTSLPLLLRPGNVVSCTTPADKKIRLDAANAGKSARELRLREVESFRPSIVQRDTKDYILPTVMRRATAKTSAKRESKAKRSMKARTTY